jgi:hypothetical protein
MRTFVLNFFSTLLIKMITFCPVGTGFTSIDINSNVSLLFHCHWKWMLLNVECNELLPDFPVTNVVALNVAMSQLCHWWRPCDQELRRGDRPYCHVDRWPCWSLWLSSHRQLWTWPTKPCRSLGNHSKHIFCCRLQVFNYCSVLWWWASKLDLLPCSCVIQLFRFVYFLAYAKTPANSTIYITLGLKMQWIKKELYCFLSSVITFCYTFFLPVTLHILHVSKKSNDLSLSNFC